MSLEPSFASSRYDGAAARTALKSPESAWRVMSALRAESEARFLEAAEAFITEQHALGEGARWSALAHGKLEGLIGILEERACDHLAASDLAALARVIPGCTAADCIDLFRTAELGDQGATERVGRRLAEAALDRLPDELHSDALGCRRLYVALRARFATLDDELSYLQRRSGMRLLASGASVLAEAHGQSWPEIIPTHGRGATNASRALTFAVAAAGPEATEKWLAEVATHDRTKARLECVGLAWSERFDGVGSGQAVRVFRAGLLVMTEAGGSHPDVAVLPNRPRRSIKVHKAEAKAKADFAKRVADLTAKHQLAAVDASGLGSALERAAGALPSDYAIALLELGAPQPDLFWFRGDPEVTRRAIVHGASAASAIAPDGRSLLAHVGPHCWDVQRAEVLVANGAKIHTPERLVEAARRGELAMARLLLRAGSPITAETREAARPWPRLAALLAG